MSYLDKLSIQGIRSFDPNTAQVVKFYPLTIILGSNGAGKTTIIEALKYVTTGMSPPNSNSGKSFLHDPTLANVSTIRGQVKLKFTDIERKSTTVTRSLESSLKRDKGKQTSKLTFKQLNAVINSNGNSIDQRCGDINIEMLSLLGVSKPVLSNVIFCHQEECNWPLSEGKVLKEKFDDIFGSMGYVKALERIRKLRRSESEKQKLLEKDVELQRHLKEESDSKKKLLSEKTSMLSVLKEDVEKADKDLVVVVAELQQILQKESSIQSLSNSIASAKSSIKEKQMFINDLKKNIKSLFNGSEDELQSEVENFEKNLQKSDSKKNLLSKQKLEMSEKMMKHEEKKQLLNKELMKLQLEEEQYKKLLTERSSVVENIHKHISVNFNDDIISKLDSNKLLDSNDISDVLKALKHEMNDLNKKLLDKKNIYDKDSELLKNELNECKAKQSNYEHEVQLWGSDLGKKGNALKEMKRKISISGMSEAEYNSLNEKIQRLNEELKKLQVIDVENRKQELTKMDSEKKCLKSEINLLEERMKKLQDQSKERVQIEILKKDKNEKELKAKQISEVHSDVMQTVGAFEGNFNSCLTNHIHVINSNLDKKSNNMSRIENELTKKETKVQMNRESLGRKKQELNEMNSKLRRVCKLDDYEKCLTDVENELKELRIESSEMSSHEPFVKKQITCIQNNDCCPVCDRDMSKQWDTKNGKKISKESIVERLENLIIKTPEDLEKIKHNIKSKEKQLKELNGLSSVVQNIRTLNEELPKLEKQLNLSIEENTTQRKTLDKEKLEINKLKNELNSLRSVSQDASDYDNCFIEMRDIESKMNLLGCDFDDESESVDDVRSEWEQKKENYDRIDSKISESSEIINKYNDKYMKVRNDLQNSEKRKLDIEREENEKINYIKSRDELENEIKVLDEKIMDSQTKAMGFNSKIYELENKLTDINDEIKDFEQKIQTKSQIINEKSKEIEKLNNNIELHNKSGKADKTNELKSQLSEINQKLSQLNNEIKIINDEIESIASEISNSELKKRDLNDNKRIFQCQKEIDIKNSEIIKHKEELGFDDLNALQRKKKELEKSEKRLDGIKQTSIGKQIPIIETIGRLEAELEIPKFKNSDKNYREKSIDLAITEISGDDLNKYYKSLDFAISAFHKRKMEEINKLVKGFWKQAYRGLDIDYIKITSDEEERSANDKKRTFNYRVVMVQNGNKELDMRGRCSAGQKVLACLVIRLALAEIFCANCSVLALDEPTTNLDKENVASFANAITEIVKYRKKFGNSNFQLIVITHDNEFLKCLDSETGQNYYKVYKNDSGYSTILRKSINDTYDDE